MTATPYDVEEVLALQDVIADAHIRGIGAGTFSMARAILEAGYRPAAAVERQIRMARAEVAEDIGDAILTHFLPDNATARQCARIACHHATAYDGQEATQ